MSMIQHWQQNNLFAAIQADSRNLLSDLEQPAKTELREEKLTLGAFMQSLKCDSTLPVLP